jgi:imidazolonepropionase-like amidohydrolase
MATTQPLVITGATLITLDGGQVIPEGWVVVQDGAITGIGSGSVTSPEGARVVDGVGLYCLPGLVDMHVHLGFPALQHPAGSAERERLSQEARLELLLYLAHGVTTVRNMWGDPFHLRLAADVEAGRVLGPRVRSTSPILDGAPPVWPTSQTLRDAVEAERVVQEYRKIGYEAVKVYNHLPATVYEHLVRTARDARIPVVGHVPFTVGVYGALAAGQRSIEHFRGYDFDPEHPPGTSTAKPRFSTWADLRGEDLQTLAARTLEAGVWNCPTLVTVSACVGLLEHGSEALPPPDVPLPAGLRAHMQQEVREPVIPAESARYLGASLPKQRLLLKLLHDGGGGLLVGTDAPLLGLVPGASLHAELKEFVAAGLTPLEALKACCTGPSRFYEEPYTGIIRAGYRADLILVDGDPLRDIANTRKVASVVAAGRFHSRDALAGYLDCVRRNQLPGYH